MAIVSGEYADLVGWLDAHPEAAGTPEYVQKANRFQELDKQQQQAPQQLPWTGLPQHNIDYGAPDEQVRAQIAGVPDERNRTAAMNRWGDAYVKREGEQAPLTQFTGDVVRSVGKGVPFVGSWLDEANAATMAGLGQPGGYDEAVAYNRARDRNFQAKHPYVNFVANTAGAVASPLAYLKGVGALGNIAYNTVAGTVSGAGEGEDSAASRGLNALVGGGVSGLLSTATAPLGAFFSKFDRSSITPAVQQAADRLGIRLPFFAASGNPEVQAAGRRAAQTTPGSQVSNAYAGSREGFDRAGNRIVQGVTGAPAETAPVVAGGVMQGAYPRVAADMGNRMRAAGQDTASMLPPGHLTDLPQHTGAYSNLVAERARDMNPTNPAGGLQWTENLVTQPGGVAWPTVDRYTSWLGRQLGRPDPMQPRVGTTQELEPLYASLMRDRESAVRGVAGQTGVDRMLANRAEQSGLAQLRDQIRNAVEQKQPEQLVNLLQSAASTRGGGTRMGTFANMTNALTPAEQQMGGAGVLANIINNTAVRPAAGEAGRAIANPAAVAAGINQIVPAARDILYPAATRFGQDVGALATVGQRLGQVDALRHVGSAATLGNDMRGLATSPLALGSGAAALAHYANLPPWLVAAVGTLGLGGAAQQAAIRGMTPYAAMHGFTPRMVDAANTAAGAIAQVPAQQETQRKLGYPTQ